MSIGDKELGVRDGATSVLVEKLQDLADDLFLLLICQVLCAFVFETIGLANVVRGPCATAVVVVKVEERASIERGDVMFLYDES